ncbi:MAG: hypothetical protein B6D56_01105 [Candidatus Omnitrophica bacterium 4484_70.1]|nr:MAG: hypothetical protein B6D56_01105 [Candidatus Omnitrophica bacterium 4484_70.1]
MCHFATAPKGGFDVVIANPPYVGHKGGQKSLFRILKKTDLGKRFNNERMDLFYYFFHLSIDIGAKRSIISFITTNYYLTADSAVKLRSDFKERTVIKNMINFGELKIFESALGQHNMITILSKNINPELVANNCLTKRTGIATSEILKRILDWNDDNTEYFSVIQKDLYEGENFKIRISGISQSTFNINKILAKMFNQGILLGNICNISQGIVTGADKVSRKHIIKFKINCKVGSGIYVLNSSEIKRLNLNQEEIKLLKPWFKNSDIRKFYTNEKSNNYLLHLTVDLDIEQYPSIYKHLCKYREIISSRNFESCELSKALRLGKWWALSSARKDINFNCEKIVTPYRSLSNTFGYNEVPWYASADVFFITSKDKKVS